MRLYVYTDQKDRVVLYAHKLADDQALLLQLTYRGWTPATLADVP